MNWAFDIGRIFGIRIRVHYLFLLFVAFLVVQQGIADARQNTSVAPALLLFILLLFGFVLLHELGHSLIARRFGIPTKDITLWPLGGIARLGRIPETPKIELLIAIAGPAVNLVIALLALPFAIAFVPDLWEQTTRLRPTSLLSACIVANVFMAGFNFIPAFPMDGGRVLRSLLGYRMDFPSATRQAVRVGRLFAFAFILCGLFTPMRMLILIGIFILIVGAQEERSVRWRSFLQRVSRDPVVLDEQGNPLDATFDDPDQAMRDAIRRGDHEAFRRILAQRMAEEAARRGGPPPMGT